MIYIANYNNFTNKNISIPKRNRVYNIFCYPSLANN